MVGRRPSPRRRAAAYAAAIALLCGFLLRAFVCPINFEHNPGQAADAGALCLGQAASGVRDGGDPARDQSKAPQGQDCMSCLLACCAWAAPAPATAALPALAPVKEPLAASQRIPLAAASIALRNRGPPAARSL